MRRFSSYQSKNFRIKRRVRKVVAVGGVVIVIAAILYILSLLSSLKSFTITNVEVAGVDQDKVGIIHDLVLEKLQDKYLGLFSRANNYIYPHREIVKIIKMSNPEADLVTLDRGDKHTLTVTVIEKTPVALICTTLPDFDDNQLSLDDSVNCYLVDANGFIFKKAPSVSGGVYNRYYIPDLAPLADLASTTGIIGMYATSTEEFQKIQKIYEGLKSNNIITDAALMKTGGEYELYVRNPGMDSSTAVIYFNTISSTTEQFSNLISFWTYSVGAARTSREKLEFDYIDVRYGDNVFFRKSK